MRSAGSRDRARARTDLIRSVKHLRDGSADPESWATRVLDARRFVSSATVPQVARELKVEPWAATLRQGSVDEVAKLSPAYVARPIDAISKSPKSARVVRPEAAAQLTEAPSRPRRQPKASVIALTTDQVKFIHDALVDEFAVTDDPIFPPGVKNEHLLESAVARQHTSLGGEPKYRTVAEVGASLFFGLSLNHPFHNGNKRTALVSLIALADRNQLDVTASHTELFDFVLKVVQHGFRPAEDMSSTDAMDIEVQRIATWIQGNLRRQMHVEPSVTWRELRRLLIVQSCTIEEADRSQIELIRGRYRSVVDFDGDKREVARGVIRKIRKDLRLRDEDGVGSDVFFGYAVPVDHFISRHAPLLRQLAHV